MVIVIVALMVFGPKKAIEIAHQCGYLLGRARKLIFELKEKLALEENLKGLKEMGHELTHLDEKLKQKFHFGMHGDPEVNEHAMDVSDIEADKFRAMFPSIIPTEKPKKNKKLIKSSMVRTQRVGKLRTSKRKV